MYRKWPRTLGDVEVCPVQPPGRESRLREPAFDSYEKLADDLVEALLPHLDRPFGLFGHCGSALPAYETAVRLVDRGLPAPTCLFVSSQVPPHLGPHGRFLEMTDDQLAEEVATLITELGGIPRPDVVELSLGVLRADVEANKRYRPAAPVYLPCPVSVLGWNQDTEVDPASMTGWSDCGRATFRVLDGPHYGFIDAPRELMDVFLLDLGRPGQLP
ncbi:thioesterase domain-containing protein [Actinophytocola sediminis]